MTRHPSTSEARTRSEAFREAVTALMAADDAAVVTPNAVEAARIRQTVQRAAIASAQDVPQLADKVDRLVQALREIDRIAGKMHDELAVTMPDVPAIRDVLNVFRNIARVADEE